MIRCRLLIFAQFMVVVSGYGQMSMPQIADAASQGMAGLQSPWARYFQPVGNPATLGDLEHHGVGVFGVQPFMLSELSTAFISGWTTVGTSGLGASVGFTGFGGYRQFATQLAFGRRLWNRFEAGVAFERHTTAFADYGSTSSHGFSLGVQMRLRKDLAMGILLRNPISIYAGQEAYILPRIMTATMAYRFSEHLELAVEWFQEQSLPVDVRVGIAYFVTDDIPLRIGYQTISHSFYTGMGWRWRSHMQLDVAAGYHPYLGFSPTLGLRYLIPRVI
jgi:hypothetical protein